MGEYRGIRRNEKQENFFLYLQEKEEGKGQRDGAREHSDIAMLPSQHVTFPPLGQRLKPNVG